MTRYLVDTNVFLYARGREHPYRQACRLLLEGASRGEIVLVASTELVQEFVHVMLRRGTEPSQAVGEADDVRRQCQVRPFDEEVLGLALGLLRSSSVLGARDAVHAATAVAARLPLVLSTDRVFDSVPEVERIDPLAAARLLGG